MRTFSEYPVQVCNLLISAQARDIQVIKQQQAAAPTAVKAAPTATGELGGDLTNNAFVSLDDESQRRCDLYRRDFIGDAVDRYLEAKSRANALLSQSTVDDSIPSKPW
jgi:hypothetical protein